MKAMRGGKGEAKVAGPLFPRLHVNDTDKGGPKPPPRNKMALYEQLSLPSRRLADSHLSMLPLPPVCCGSVTNIESSSQDLGIEKATFPSFQISASAYHSEGRHGSFSASADKLRNKTDGNTSQRSITIQQTRNIDVMEISDRTSMCAFEPGNASNFKWPSLVNDDTESKAPSIGYLAMDTNRSNDHLSSNKESYFAGSNPLQSTALKRLKTFNSPDQQPEEPLKVLNGNGMTIHETGQGHERNQRNYPQARPEDDKTVTDGVAWRHNISPTISLKPLNGEEQSELPNHSPTSPHCNHKSSGQNETDNTKAWDHVGMNLGLNKVPSGEVIEQPAVSGANNGGVLRSELCHESRATYSSSENTIRNSHLHEEEKEPGLVPTYILKRDDDISNASHKGSKSGVFICPDDIVEMIGQKRFWKARRAIIDQQRAFAMQVFELHRIIKVQEIIAGSRSLVMKESLFLGKAVRKASAIKESSHNPITDDPLSLVKPRDDLPKFRLANDNTAEKKARTLRNDATNVANNGHKLGNPVDLPSLYDPKVPTPMWCLPQLGNQWLIPVMSPSEGLVYKPCTEPPTLSPGGVLANLYGSVGPMKATVPGGELLNSHGGYLPSAAPLAPSYYSPCGMPILSPSGPIPTVEHTGAKTVGSEDITSLYQSSCTVASEKYVGRTLIQKEAESLESKASVPKKRNASDALPLFPTAPTDRVSVPPVRSGSNEQKTEVIRVIPRNPKLASESAARIIQLIQEERKYLCN